ncbi:MAG: hypothetical protein H7Z21_14315 [Hymenobacter sp.]|nr:hypothetical protein [Hymenobacter sp.]
MLLISLLSGLGLAAVAAGLAAPSTPPSVGEQAFRAWALGEQTGNYTPFRALLGPGFRSFAHPLRGRFAGAEARAQLEALLAEREAVPNALTFSNVVVTANADAVVYQFDSAGQVAGGYAYQGYNVLAFEVTDGALVGLREYFGYVDPQWFQQ